MFIQYYSHHVFARFIFWNADVSSLLHHASTGLRYGPNGPARAAQQCVNNCREARVILERHGSRPIFLADLWRQMGLFGQALRVEFFTPILIEGSFTTRRQSMTIRTLSRTAISAAGLALLLSFSATPAIADSSALQAPARLSCIHLPAALSGIETKGLFKVESETRLERGPYISEGEDADGTYFRAPPGGVYLGPPKDKPAKGAWQLNRDGGIFVPRDPSAPPQLYSYVTDDRTSAATLVPPATADCSNTRYVRDPVTKAVKAAKYTGEGMTQTDAKQVGVIDVKQVGLIGHGLVGSMLSDFLQGPENGTIVKLPQSGNPEFNAKLREFARKAVPVESTDVPD
jgi:hypothetical protein